jgi:hypothetical protein
MPYIVESVKAAIRDVLRALEGEEIVCMNFVWRHGIISINRKGGVYEINDDCIDERPVILDRRMQINTLIHYLKSKAYDAKFIEEFIYVLLNRNSLCVAKNNTVRPLTLSFETKLLDASIDLLEAAKAFTDLYEQASE